MVAWCVWESMTPRSRRCCQAWTRRKLESGWTRPRQRRFCPYSDPPVAFEPAPGSRCPAARSVVAVEVSEFDRDPHVCKRSYQGVLQDGQTYVRPRGQPRSVPIPSSAEGRELHELAIDKGVREFVRRAGAAGIPLGPMPSPEDVERAAYDQEAQEAWAAETTVDRRDAAFSDVSVRPVPDRG